MHIPPVPPVSPALSLLRAVGELSPVGRVPELAARARVLSARGEVDSVLEELWSSGEEEQRFLAVDLARMTHHAELLERALAEGGTALRRRVLHSRELVRLAPARVVRAVLDAPDDDRMVLYRKIRQRDLRELAEALREPVRGAFGTGEEALLLPACGAKTVGERLPELWDEIRHRRLLTRRHPDLVVAEPHGRGFAQASDAQPGAEAANPLGAARLSGRRMRRTLRRLLLAESADPAGLGGPAGATGGTGPDEPTTSAELAALVRTADTQECLGLRRLLAAAPVRQRSRLYEAACAAKPFGPRDVGTGLVPLLMLLPHEHRAREARRLRREAETDGRHDEWTVHDLAPLISLAEVRDELLELTRRPQTEDRRCGYRLLIECAAAHSGEHTLDDLLPLLADRLPKDDGAGIRDTALRALAETPVARFHARAVPALDRLVHGLLAAPDPEGGLARGVAWLAGTLLTHEDRAVADFAAQTLRACWLRPRSAEYGLQWLPGDRVRLCYPHLEPAMTAAADQGHFTPAIELFRIVGAAPAVLTALHAAVREGDEDDARRAVDALLADRRTRGAAFQDILDHTPNSLRHPRMRRWAQWRRPELLEGLWAAYGPLHRPTHDRPTTGPAPYQRWTSAQREQYAALLVRDVTAARPARAGREAARELARLFRADPVLTGPYLDSRHPFVARAALSALPFGDDPEVSLHTLLLQDFPHDGETSWERNETADRVMTAIRRCARRIPPSRRPQAAAAGLRALLVAADDTADGLTATTKEQARFLTTLTAAAAGVVADVWEAEGHRPVVARVCVWLAGGLLDEPRIWRLLRASVRTGEHHIVHELDTFAWHVPEQHRSAYAELLIGAATGPVARSRCCALAKLRFWHPYHPDVPQVLAAAAIGARERAEWQTALDSLIVTAASPEGEERLAQVLDAFAVAAKRTGPDEAPVPDGPLHRLVFALDRLDWRSARTSDRSKCRAMLLRLAARLGAHPEFALEARLLRTSTVHGLWRVQASVLAEDVDALIELVEELERVLVGALG
ncbi:hypothetical protein ACFH04_01045 [Streptomyces noboritoensis]|uniref:Uncharacterized protein n=1 Tax=Streptomyces noboritoensis TaxID=67337 RepID=A0ABV6T974_9ACTN